MASIDSTNSRDSTVSIFTSAYYNKVSLMKNWPCEYFTLVTDAWTGKQCPPCIALDLPPQDLIGRGGSEDENNLGFTDFTQLIAFIGNEGAVGTVAATIGGTLNPNVKEWRTTFPSSKPITPQPPMKFFPSADLNGKRVVDYAAGDFSSGIKRCEDYVVGFCVGKRLSFATVKDAATKHWKLKNEVSIKLHSKCAFIFEFKEDEDRKKVLKLGSFYISSCLFTMRPWSNLIESSISSIRTLPIGVLIYNVPLHMWDNERLSLISSFLGKPILADDYTLNRTRLSYARVCIEIDVEFDYPLSIPLMIDGKIAWEMPVEYQWKPPKCDVWKVFGHSSTNCSKKLKPRWSTKKNGKFVEKSLSKDQGDKESKNEGSVDTQAKVADKGVDKGIVPPAKDIPDSGHGLQRLRKKSVDDTSLSMSGDKVGSMVKSQVAPAKSSIKTASIQKSGEGKHNPFIVKGHGNWETASSRKSPAKHATTDR
ncbi:hypothetical protein C5167_000417 [Papaver somniferum]|uniref:DUF4283 domain-containing protein n=1 Tax=Papaver somniferum TaxID=3469 RepID=A0A4Y7KTV9_PAPSO|nr:hypothetical protein C5167_000417 [Papaver somniferum]